MSRSKHIDKICIAIISVTLVITVLFMFGEKLGITVVKSEEDESINKLFTENDLNADWDTSGATVITLNDNTAKVSGNGAYFSDDTVNIVYAGKYLISGNLNGSIQIDADGDDKIWIMLDGVNITSSSYAPICINQADKVFITLKEDSENTLTFSNENENAETDGAIFSRDDLTINGSGKLSVSSSTHHGIVCNDKLVISGGDIDITAKTDAVHAHDAINICNANITVKAGDDGLHAGNDTETSTFYMESGNIDISECYEGIEANNITIAGGTVNITPNDDGLNANGSGANSVITISGGNITVINENGRDADGFDSNGSINITGGNTFVSVVGSGTNSALDFGSENGGICTISGGTLIACGSSAMAEGPEQTSSQGFIMQTVSGNANDTLSIFDKNGSEIISKEIPCSFTSVVVSSPDIIVGENVTMKIGDTSTEITVDNSSSSGGFGGMKKFGGFNNGSDNQNRKENENKKESDMPAENDDKSSKNSVELLSNTDNFNSPKMPDGNFNGTPPQKPDGDDNFTPPQMPSDENSTMQPPNGTPPDFDSNGGSFPSFNNEDDSNSSQDSEQLPSIPNENDEDSSLDSSDTDSNTFDNRKQFGGNGENSGKFDNQNEQEQNKNESETISKDSSADLSTLIWVAVSFLILGVGIVVAKYKKY